MPAKTSKFKAEKLRQISKMDAVFEYRLRGHSYSEIAEVLELEESQVAKMLEQATDKVGERLCRNMESLKNIELARLERLQTAVWPMAMGKKARKAPDGTEIEPEQKPVLKAVEKALNITAERSKILGLYAAQKINHGSGADEPTDDEANRVRLGDLIARKLVQLASQPAADAGGSASPPAKPDAKPSKGGRRKPD